MLDSPLKTMRIKLLFLALIAFPSSLLADVRYTMAPDVATGTVRISVSVDDTHDKVAFHIPAWVPGYYLILQNQDKLGNFSAVDGNGGKLDVERTDLRTWTVSNPTRSKITLSYSVLGDDPGLGFFAVHMDSMTGYVNGPAAFVYADGHMLERDTLSVTLPAGWDIATSMDRREDGVFQATGYDAFVDHPIQMGKFESTTFKVGETPFEAVFVGQNGRVDCDIRRESRELQMLSEPAMKLFGGVPFAKYVYIIHLAVGNFSGGLEHRASNVQAVDNAPELNLDNLAAHEYFHAWNVKQIRPMVLGPFDYTQPVYTANLWFAEGVTDYYAYITTYRSGVKGQNWLLYELGSQISRLEASGERHSVTLEECSRRAWENGGMGVGDLSYYNKGLVAGLLFDAAIRGATNGAKSLDDVMRLMYLKYKLPNPGYPEDGILAAINQVSGQDFSGLYHSMIQTTDEMPYGLLSGIGLRYDPGTQIHLTKDLGAGPTGAARLKEWLSLSGNVTH